MQKQSDQNPSHGLYCGLAQRRRIGISLMLAGSMAALSISLGSIGMSDEPSEVPPQQTSVVKKQPVAERPSLAQARQQAKLLHSTMHATLHAVHHELYRPDEGLPLPAKVLKDVFEEIEKEEHVKLRWLVVEGQAMNTDHQARTTFEHEAVKALKSGQQSFERVEEGVYQRAGTITLTNQCLKCHVPDRKNTKDRTAGLIITIPIMDK